MSTRSSLAGRLHSFIDNTRCVKDLECILSSIPIQLIQNFVKEYIQTMEKSDYDALAIRSCPITDILDVNVIQYVLSFNISPEVNSVNKLFNQLSIHNEHVFLNKELDKKYESVQITVNKHHLQYLKLQRLSSSVCRCIGKTNARLTSLKQRQQRIEGDMNKATTRIN
eukprot:68159_1